MRRWIARTLSVIIWIFGLAALVSLAFAIIGAKGLFGGEPDPFAAIFAILLSMPWFALLDESIGGDTEFWGFALMLAGIGVNLAILFVLRGLLRRGLRGTPESTR